MLFSRKRGIAHSYFLHENESLQHSFSYELRQMAMFLVLEIRFFQRICFLDGQFFLRSRVQVQFRFLDDGSDMQSIGFNIHQAPMEHPHRSTVTTLSFEKSIHLNQQEITFSLRNTRNMHKCNSGKNMCTCTFWLTFLIIVLRWLLKLSWLPFPHQVVFHNNCLM